MTWHPLSTCPENTQVLFGWASGLAWVGNLHRMPQLHFRGAGAYALNADDNPPTRWCEIPKWEE